MLLDIGRPLAFGGDHRVAYIARVVRALDRRRLAAGTLVTLLFQKAGCSMCKSHRHPWERPALCAHGQNWRQP
jgi:hypothetical protein